MKLVLQSREEAINTFREMWSDMQLKLGDNPTPQERIEFKKQWCKENNIELYNWCSLCNYVWMNYELSPAAYNGGCKYCPIEWSFLTNDCEDIQNRNRCYAKKYSEDSLLYSEFWMIKPISTILSLPERDI